MTINNQEVPEWWSQIDTESREWLRGNLDEMIPADTAYKILAAGGHVVGAPGWDGEPSDTETFSISNIEWDLIRNLS